MKLPFVSIVICTHNRAESLEKYALPSLEKLGYPDFEVILVCDECTDTTFQVFEKFKNKFHHKIQITKSKGLSHARNVGISHAKGSIVAFVDDDCAVEKDWLNELVKRYEDKAVMGVGGLSFIGHSSKRFNPPEVVYGCNMSFRKEVFENFLFDQNIYFAKYSHYDEIDLLNRITHHGLKIVTTDKAVVRHFVEPAAYRKNAFIGGPLNFIYLTAKKMGVRKYYFVLLHHLIAPSPKVNHDVENGFHQLKSLRRVGWIQLFYIFFSLVFLIPWKIVKNKEVHL